MAATRQERQHISQWYTVKRQRVKQANLSMEKDGVYERPGSSWTTGRQDNWRGGKLDRSVPTESILPSKVFRVELGAMKREC